MEALRRQQLVRVDAAGWRQVLASATDSIALDCLSHWADRQLPLVVTQQRCLNVVCLGLPAPQQWQRRRIGLEVPAVHLRAAGDFPTLVAVAALLPPALRPAGLVLADVLHSLGVAARVYGSHGWQQLTGLNHVHADSDIDLRLEVPDATRADAAVAVLQGVGFATPRLDGELAFPDGSAVAWREWRLWRAGDVDRVLVKRLQGVAMEFDNAWLGAAQPC